MNTASGAASVLTNANPRLAGAGVIQVDRAATSVALATDPSLSYGYEPLGGAYTETLTVTIANSSAAAITYALSSAFSGSALGTDVTFSAPSVIVPAGGENSFDVTLALTAGRGGRTARRVPSAGRLGDGPRGRHRDAHVPRDPVSGRCASRSCSHLAGSRT